MRMNFKNAFCLTTRLTHFSIALKDFKFWIETGQHNYYFSPHILGKEVNKKWKLYSAKLKSVGLFKFLTIISFRNAISLLCFSTDKLQARRGFPYYQIWLHSLIWLGDRDLHLHEPHQWRDHLCYRSTRGHLRHHRGQQEGTGKNVTQCSGIWNCMFRMAAQYL